MKWRVYFGQFDLKRLYTICFTLLLFVKVCTLATAQRGAFHLLPELQTFVLTFSVRDSL